jgi:hypothetical protein
MYGSYLELAIGLIGLKIPRFWRVRMLKVTTGFVVPVCPSVVMKQLSSN